MTFPVGSRVAFRGLTIEQAKIAAELFHMEAGRDTNRIGITLSWGGCSHASDFLVEHVDHVEDLLLRCLYCNEKAWACAAWVELAGQPVSPCSCDLRRGGCSCGAFLKEQEARGLRRNRWTGIWERPRT